MTDLVERLRNIASGYRAPLGGLSADLILEAADALDEAEWLIAQAWAHRPCPFCDGSDVNCKGGRWLEKVR